MATVTFTGFGSKTYEVVVSTGQARWTFYVRHIPTDTVTYRFVCHEGYAEYMLLKRLWRRCRQDFERRCATYTYYT